MSSRNKPNQPRSRAIAHAKKHKRQNFSPMAMEDETTKNRVATLMTKRPGIRQSEIAAILGVTRGRISQLVRQISSEWKEERIHKYEIDLDRRINEIGMIKEMCMDRLKRIKSPAQGSRWAEMFLKAIKQEAQMLGLNAPEVHEIKSAGEYSKEDRDALVRAAVLYEQTQTAEDPKQIEAPSDEDNVMEAEIVDEGEHQAIK